MAGALESTITLEDVFAMLGAKRVPLAPELAGYLALEIAEGADGAGGDVDPRAVYIAEEGTVALVKPRQAPAGDPEGSIRAILGKLLEASGSRTPALLAAARRKSVGNLRALAEELEAALIPVNRAAGRRALARLAREVKRVAMRAGRVGGSPPLAGEPAAVPRSGLFSPDEEATTARRPVPSGLADEMLPSGSSGGAPSPRRAGMPRPLTVDFEDVAEPEAPPPSSGGADVDSLLDQFSRSSQRPDPLVARDLKAMAGLDPTPPPPRTPSAPPRGSDRPSDGGVDALLALSEPVSGSGSRGGSLPSASEGLAGASYPRAEAPATPPQAPSSKRAAAARLSQRPSTESAKRSLPMLTPEPSPRPARVSQAEIPTGATLRRQAGISRVPTGEFRRLRTSRSDVWLVLVLLALIAIGAGIVWTLKPGFLTGRTPEKVAQEKAAAEAARQQAAMAQQALGCKVALEITDVPANAEVLLREGQAPVDVERMPVGARLEFVATAEGYAPKRAVVPAGVTWDTGAGNKPRYEVAVQLDKSSKPKGDIWPPGEPGSEVGGKGPSGTVHIVTTPRGADVWLLAGIGPDAQIEGLSCDQDVDVLVAGPTTLRKRIHVAAPSFAPGPGAPPNGRFAKVSAK